MLYTDFTNAFFCYLVFSLDSSFIFEKSEVTYNQTYRNKDGEFH